MESFAVGFGDPEIVEPSKGAQQRSSDNCMVLLYFTGKMGIMIRGFEKMHVGSLLKEKLPMSLFKSNTSQFPHSVKDVGVTQWNATMLFCLYLMTVFISAKN